MNGVFQHGTKAVGHCPHITKIQILSKMPKFQSQCPSKFIETQTLNIQNNTTYLPTTCFFIRDVNTFCINTPRRASKVNYFVIKIHHTNVLNCIAKTIKEIYLTLHMISIDSFFIALRNLKKNV